MFETSYLGIEFRSVSTSAVFVGVAVKFVTSGSGQPRVFTICPPGVRGQRSRVFDTPSESVSREVVVQVWVSTGEPPVHPVGVDEVMVRVWVELVQVVQGE